MRNKPLNKLMRRIMWNNKGKIFIIAFVLSFAITIFTAFGFSNAFLQHNVNILQNEYRSFDFMFIKDKSYTDKKIENLAKKYDFKYEQKEYGEVESIDKIPNKQPVVHYDNNNSFGIKYLISSEQMKDKISKPFVIDGRWVKADNEVVVLPQLLKVLNKKIGDTVKVKNMNLKIVGTYSTPQYQKNISTSLTDHDSYIIPIQVNKNTYEKFDGLKSTYYFGYFNKKTNMDQRKKVYEKMSNEKDFIQNTPYPIYKHIKKTLKYYKEKICANQNLIEQYANNPELKIEQFNRLAAMILQAQNGGNCRTTLGDKSFNNAQTNDLDYVNKLAQANSATDNVNTNVNDLTPHYKTAKLLTYTPRTYSYSPEINDFAGKIADQMNLSAHYFFEQNDINNMKATYGTNNFNLLYKKYTTAKGVLQAAEAGEKQILFNYSWVDRDGKNGDFIKEAKGFHPGESLQEISDGRKQPIIIDTSQLVSGIAADKSSFAQEENARKSKIDEYNNAQKASVKQWNDAENKRVAELKAQKSKLNTTDFKSKQKELKDKLIAQKKQAEIQDKKMGIVTTNFQIKVLDKTLYKKVKLLTSVQDFDEIPTSKGIVEQMSKQTLISTLLFVIFSILTALLIVIILQKIINDNKSEFGTLKALGIREKQISSKFLSIPVVTIVLSVIFSYCMFNVTYTSIVNFLNGAYYLPVSKYFEVNYWIVGYSILIPSIVLVTYTKISTKSLLGKKTLNLLNDIKDNHSHKGPKWLKKASTTIKLQYKTIRYNKDKSLIVFSCGLIITFLLSLVSIMYFSSAQTYGFVGKDLTYSSINIKQTAKNNETNTPNEILFESFKINGVLDHKYNLKSFANKPKRIDVSNSIDLNVMGVQVMKSKAFDISQMNASEINKGVILPNKYKVLYGINVGDLLQTEFEGKQIFINVSGFQTADENVFSFTSAAYLSSITNQMGKVNGQIINSPIVQLDKDDKFAIDKNLASESINSVLQNIVLLIAIVAIVIIVIITPLIFILVSNIIDSNIKTIATLKAIGFNLGKIRSLTINPYIPIFIIGEIIGISLVWGYFGDQIINIFFGYFGYDVILHFTINFVFLIVTVIFIVYQFIITVSSQRINIVKTARILNEDSGQVRISNEDVKHYFKSSSKSLIDLEKPEFRFKWKDVTKLSRKEHIKFAKEILKRYWPMYVANFTTSWMDLIMSSSNLWLNNTLIPIKQYTYAVTQLIGQLDSMDIVKDITSANGVYKVQFAKRENVEAFKDTVKIDILSNLLYGLFKVIIFFLLGDIIAFLVDLSDVQRKLMYLTVLTIFISDFSGLILVKFEQFHFFMETFPRLVTKNISKLFTIPPLVIQIVMYKYVLSHYISWIFIQMLIGVGLNIFVYFLYIIIFRKYKYYKYIDISVFDMFIIHDWGIFRRVVKDSMPAVHASIVNIPLGLVTGIITTRFMNNIVVHNANYLLITNTSQFISSQVETYWPTSLQELISNSIMRVVGSEKFSKTLQRARMAKRWLFVTNIIPMLISFIAKIVLLFVYPVSGLASQLLWVQVIIFPINTWILYNTTWNLLLLTSGSEFKFSAYFGVVFTNIIPSISTIIFGTFGIMQFSVIGDVLASLFAMLAYRKRILTGRWLFSSVTKRSLVNVQEEFELLKPIMRDKSGKYVYDYKDRTLHIPEDVSL